MAGHCNQNSVKSCLHLFLKYWMETLPLSLEQREDLSLPSEDCWSCHFKISRIAILLLLHLKALGPPGTSGTIPLYCGICLENERGTAVIQSQLSVAGAGAWAEPSGANPVRRVCLQIPWLELSSLVTVITSRCVCQWNVSRAYPSLQFNVK